MSYKKGERVKASDLDKLLAFRNEPAAGDDLIVESGGLIQKSPNKSDWGNAICLPNATMPSYVAFAAELTGHTIDSDRHLPVIKLKQSGFAEFSTEYYTNGKYEIAANTQGWCKAVGNTPTPLRVNASSSSFVGVFGYDSPTATELKQGWPGFFSYGKIDVDGYTCVLAVRQRGMLRGTVITGSIAVGASGTVDIRKVVSDVWSSTGTAYTIFNDAGATLTAGMQVIVEPSYGRWVAIGTC